MVNCNYFEWNISGYCVVFLKELMDGCGVISLYIKMWLMQYRIVRLSTLSSLLVKRVFTLGLLYQYYLPIFQVAYVPFNILFF